MRARTPRPLGGSVRDPLSRPPSPPPHAATSGPSHTHARRPRSVANIHALHTSCPHEPRPTRRARPHDLRVDMLRHNLQLAVRASHVAHRVAPHPHTPAHRHSQPTRHLRGHPLNWHMACGSLASPCRSWRATNRIARKKGHRCRAPTCIGLRPPSHEAGTGTGMNVTRARSIGPVVTA